MTETAEFGVADNPAEERYELWHNGELAGWIDCALRHDNLVLLHTEVQEPRRNRGLGSRLVRSTLDDLRTSGRLMVPICPFITAFIRNNPEYRDLIARP
ncbi:MAG: GNAT family N-acetyltransferase [Gaiellaceae bacterium]